MRNVVILFISVFFLSGCLYPESERASNMPPDDAQIDQVQFAVEKFNESTDGLLPIKNVEDPIDYMKYQIDFNRLIPTYLAEHPTNAYEAGGRYQYVIIDPEDNPTVKIADLAIFEKMRSLQLRVQGMGPHIMLGEEIGPNVYQLDLEFYNLDENPTITSPYTGNELNVYYSGGQQFVVDYREDIGFIMNDKGLEFETGDDVREILYEYTPVVPVFSPAITVDESNDPVFMTSHHRNN